jgi:integration host factor subunit beta
MNKSELTQQLAEKLNTPAQDAASIIDTILKSMTEALMQGKSIEIRGFGSFTVKEYKSYTGRNPKTGERIKVEPKKLPVFRVGRELKKRVDEG